MAIALTAADSALVLILSLAWLLAGAAAIRLPMAAQRGTLRGWTALSLALIGVAALLVGLRIAVVVGLSGHGWWFVQEKVLLSLPLVAVPAAATVSFSVPLIWRLRRRRRAEGVRLRAAAAHPAIGVPVRAATFGALAGLAVAYPATGVDAAVLTSLAVAATGLAWWRQELRRRRRADPAAPARPGFGARAARATAVAGVCLVTLVAMTVPAASSTRLPDRMGMNHHTVEYGGGAPFLTESGDHGADGADGANGADGAGVDGAHASRHATGGGVSVAELRGDDAEGPVTRFTLTAQEKRLRTPSGEEVDVWTYNGQVPGPALRVRHGDVVEVTLVNKLPDEGVTVHWHGYDVPNGEDGVAGVTQNAVRPGERFTYRFRAEQVGTYWYHSHQRSHESVSRGLYGTLVVGPRRQTQSDSVDLTVPYHQFPGGVAYLGDSDVRERRTVTPGAQVRLRLVNTDNRKRSFALHGVAYRLAAIDGTEVRRPGELSGGEELELAAGGRYDLTFTMRDSPVLLTAPGRGGSFQTAPGLLLSPDGAAELPADTTLGETLDITAYGERAPTPYGPRSRYDRHFTQVLDARMGFFDGLPNYVYTVNGEVYPNIPTMGVKQGELIKVTVVNRSFEDHPMHPHGHHVLVLSRNGKPVTGSPLWMDTFNVGPGEVWEVAMKADNPGIWMDHCHDLWHARNGMMFHLAYQGVTSPYQVGRGTHNDPE